MLNWLRQRLSPVKADTPRWYELANSLETFWDTQFSTLYDPVEGLLSIYTSSDADQVRKISEHGPYYEQDLPAESRPIYFALRKTEMLQKETDVPIRMSIQRMGVEGVEWAPLYAPRVGDYGTQFIREAVVPNMDDYYMTSRGMVKVNITLADDAAAAKADDLVRKLKPLHIVYDGVMFLLPQTNQVPVVGTAMVISEKVTLNPFVLTDIEQQDDLFSFVGAMMLHEHVTIYPKA